MKLKNTLILPVLILAATLSGCYFVPSTPSNDAIVEKAKKPAREKKSSERGTETITGTVVHISDGDTFIVEKADSGERIKIRMHAVDTPEIAQTFGKESREQLRALIANQTVEIRKQTTDRYQRTVGAVFLDGRDIGLEMIAGGYAWHYKAYQKEQTPENQKAYADAENTARSSRLGLWSKAGAKPPWDYRQGKRK